MPDAIHFAADIAQSIAIGLLAGWCFMLHRQIRDMKTVMTFAANTASVVTDQLSELVEQVRAEREETEH